MNRDICSLRYSSLLLTGIESERCEAHPVPTGALENVTLVLGFVTLVLGFENILPWRLVKIDLCLEMWSSLECGGGQHQTTVVYCRHRGTTDGLISQRCILVAFRHAYLPNRSDLT